MVIRREQYLPCDLLFGASPDKEQSTSDYMPDLVDWLHDIHQYAHHHLKVASDKIKAH
jgi:hypothetical protein